ncbi:unnamed protein product [Phyllotreta striolata]|uniref:Cytochrome P450 n=1 Tax=Phyllotreta striolata TaxID=444603 RepID=A0A9N9TNU6_PHYSR|nr:unnamed protein product [Phyllotreta striolata]
MILSTSWIPDAILFLLTLFALLYFYATRKFNYWKNRNVVYQKPIPFFGNFKDVITLQKTIGNWLRDGYEAMKPHPYFGTFVFDEPYLVIKDPLLVKHVLVKDFQVFSDRTTATGEHNEVFRHFLFFMRNPQWTEWRRLLSPIFTSGKLKTAFPVIARVGERFQEYLASHQGELDAKEVAAKYSTDVIAKAFFGIEAHCFDDDNAIFRVASRRIFDFNLRNGIVTTVYFSLQNLVKIFKIDFTERWVTDYFTKCFMHAFDVREKQGLRVNDFIDFLIDLKRKDTSGDFDILKLKGAGMQFFLAGFETTSSTISFTLHELCLNRTIQDKVRSEILSNLEEHNGLTYEGVLNMKYLDMCIKETLRKYPVLPFLDRKCSEDYKLPGTDLTIEKGTNIYIPMFGLQYDEQYFPEPEKFDPDRFLDSKKCNANGLVYFPFGEGPRICIGERIGLLSVKLGLISVLTKFEVERCRNTPDPVDFAPKSLVLQSKVGLPMTFKRLTS